MTTTDQGLTNDEKKRMAELAGSLAKKLSWTAPEALAEKIAGYLETAFHMGRGSAATPSVGAEKTSEGADTLVGERHGEPTLSLAGRGSEEPAAIPHPSEALDEHDPVPAGELPLDPGIRRYVLLLRSAGLETYESCQGGPGHPCPEPFVRFAGNDYEGFRAFAIAMTFGLPVAELRHSYRVIDGRLHGPWWELTFRTTDPEITSREASAVIAERTVAGA